MNDKEIDNIIKNRISAFKARCSFAGSPDYLSGVNDGMYVIGKELINEYEFKIKCLKESNERLFDNQII